MTPVRITDIALRERPTGDELDATRRENLRRLLADVAEKIPTGANVRIDVRVFPDAPRLAGDAYVEQVAVDYEVIA